MKKQFISLLLVVAMIFAVTVPAAAEEAVSLDPFEEITAEFLQAKYVETYDTAVRPSRITGWAALRWAPSYSAPIIETYSAGQLLTVLRETPNWLMVQNLESGDIGYISKLDVADSKEIGTTSPIELSEAESGKTALGVVDANGVFSLECALPEGYSIATGYSSGDQMYAVITSEDPAKPTMRLTVGFEKEYAEVDRMNDLDWTEMAKLEETFIRNDPIVEISYGETHLGTRLLIAKLTNGSKYYMDFMSIYKGYLVECVLLPAWHMGINELTEGQVKMCIDFLTDMDFISEDDDDEEAQINADERYLARLTDYNSEDNTVKVEVLEKLEMDRELVDSLKAGDTVTVENETIKVEELDKTDYGIMVNNQYFFEYGDGTVVHVSSFNHPFYQTVFTKTMKIPKNLVFIEGIDEADGSIREEAATFNAEEFIRILEEAGSPDFDADNVYVTFDADGELKTVERFYVAWQ